LLKVFVPTNIINRDLSKFVHQLFALWSDENTLSKFLKCQATFHELRGRPREIRVSPIQEKAGRNKSIERIAHDAKLEIRFPGFARHLRPDLACGYMAMLKLGNFRNRQTLLAEQDLLFPVCITQMLPQCLTNRVRCRFSQMGLIGRQLQPIVRST
jgi:hypothetical protein